MLTLSNKYRGKVRDLERARMLGWDNWQGAPEGPVVFLVDGSAMRLKIARSSGTYHAPVSLMDLP